MEGGGYIRAPLPGRNRGGGGASAPGMDMGRRSAVWVPWKWTLRQRLSAV